MIKDKLAATSHIYTSKSELYELFSQAEDFPKKIVSLKPKLQNKIVLDFGCGTGKFIPDLSVVSKEFIATDVSESQLKIARKKSKHLANVK